jgi:O-antigen/teichoic acid export membrane protein
MKKELCPKEETGGQRKTKSVGLERRLPLRINFIWTFLGNGTYNGCQWAMLVVLAKFGSPELVGRYTLALALTAPVFMLSNMNLATVLASDAKNRYSFGDYFSLRVISSLASLVFVALLVVLWGYGGDLVLAVALVASSKFVESMSDIAYGRMQKHERMDFMAISMIIKGLLSLAIFSLIQHFTGSLSLSLAGLCAVWTLLLLAYDFPVVRRWESVRPGFSPRMLKSIFILSIPLGIVSGLSSLSVQVPRFAMERFHGERELGIFAAITSLGLLTRLVTLALSRSALPRFSQHYAAGDLDRYKKLIFRLMALGLVVGLAGFFVAWFFGSTLLTWAFTKEYAGHTDVLMVVMLGAGFTASFNFMGTAATAAQRFAPQMIVHAAKILCIAGICFAMVPAYGALGAAWAFVGGTLVSCLAYSIIVWKAIKDQGIGLDPIRVTEWTP